MIVEDIVELLPYDAIKSEAGQIGTVIGHREVGLQMHTIDYEYLVKFPDGKLYWIPARYLKEVKDNNGSAY